MHALHGADARQPPERARAPPRCTAETKPRTARPWRAKQSRGAAVHSCCAPRGACALPRRTSDTAPHNTERLGRATQSRGAEMRSCCAPGGAESRLSQIFIGLQPRCGHAGCGTHRLGRGCASAALLSVHSADGRSDSTSPRWPRRRTTRSALPDMPVRTGCAGGQVWVTAERARRDDGAPAAKRRRARQRCGAFGAHFATVGVGEGARAIPPLSA